MQSCGSCTTSVAFVLHQRILVSPQAVLAIAEVLHIAFLSLVKFAAARTHDYEWRGPGKYLGKVRSRRNEKLSASLDHFLQVLCPHVGIVKPSPPPRQAVPPQQAETYRFLTHNADV